MSDIVIWELGRLVGFLIVLVALLFGIWLSNDRKWKPPL